MHLYISDVYINAPNKEPIATVQWTQTHDSKVDMIKKKD